MKFSTTEDVNVAKADLFARVADFDRFETLIRKRGAELARTDDLTGQQAGMTWQGGFSLRGKRRAMQAVLNRFAPPDGMVFDLTSPGLKGHFEVALSALSPRRTRLRVTVEMQPVSLPARLLIQSLKLARPSIDRRFKLAVANYARKVESETPGA
ncbi:MAG: SRPBCC family protein [Rhodobacteraceae bacterium]|nr:SRPBCC family protein [Paracoccaceae bacterium]